MMRVYRNRRNNVERMYFAKENAIGTNSRSYVQEREFVRNEIFRNSARPMGFSRPSTSLYSANDGKLYGVMRLYNFKIWFSKILSL